MALDDRADNWVSGTLFDSSLEESRNGKPAAQSTGEILKNQ